MHLIPHNNLWHDEHEINTVIKIVESGQWAGGFEVERMERRFAEISGFKYAVAVSSGISALRLSLFSYGLTKGDKVGIPAYSCVAIPNAVLALGCQPVEIDIERDSLNISTEHLKNVKNLKAVVSVNTFGKPANYKSFKELKIPLIEDCSHGFGAFGMGSFGDISFLSVYATKLISGGQGGVIMTNDPVKFNRIKDASDYVDKGISAFRQRETMSALEAGLTNCSLDRLKESINRRRNLAMKYDEAFVSNNFDENRIWYRYVIREKFAEDLISFLKNKGIIAKIPIENWTKNNLNEATKAYKELVSIPLYPSLTANEQKYIIKSVKEFKNY